MRTYESQLKFTYQKVDELEAVCDQQRQRIAELEAEARHPTTAEREGAGVGPGIGKDGKFHEGGLPNTPEERARFEAYMRGHCWSIGTYDESIRAYDTVDVRRLYGVWRDRGSLPTAPLTTTRD
jgi:hypothetical protein